MRFLLDTNVCIEYLRGRNLPLKKRLQALPPDDVGVCSIVVGELMFGAYRSGDVAGNIRLIDKLLINISSLPFDDQCARLFGELRADLASRGASIGPYDLQIAAVELQNKLTLVTHNTAEFSRVTGLTIDDWH